MESSGVNSLTASLNCGHPGLVWVYPYCREAKHFVPICTSSSQDEKEGDLTFEFLWVAPGLETSEGRKFKLGYGGGTVEVP